MEKIDKRPPSDVLMEADDQRVLEDRSFPFEAEAPKHSQGLKEAFYEFETWLFATK